MTEPKALKDMTWEEAEPIYRAFNEGRPIEEYNFVGNPWQTVHNPNPIWRISTYRVKQTKPSINWEHLKPEIVAIAEDEDGELWGYSIKPFLSEEEGAWLLHSLEGDGYILDGYASYVPGTCDWKESLVIRPGHEVKE